MGSVKRSADAALAKGALRPRSAGRTPRTYRLPPFQGLQNLIDFRGRLAAPAGVGAPDYTLGIEHHDARRGIHPVADVKTLAGGNGEGQLEFGVLFLDGLH